MPSLETREWCVKDQTADEKLEHNLIKRLFLNSHCSAILYPNLEQLLLHLDT